MLQINQDFAISQFAVETERTPDKIPFNYTAPVGNEQKYMTQAIASGHISGNGPFTKQCQALLKHLLGTAQVLLTTSCTHALEISALLLDIRPGDEVILPSFTFVSTANAFLLRGARPVFVDIRPDTLNMDETKLEPLISPRTKAIVPVHYGGVGCEMDAIMDIAGRHGVAVIEDNAHSLFGRYKGQFLGTFGSMATQSFHETKNFTCGEGGALLINDPQYIERAEIIWEKGTNRSSFFRGQVDKYTWVDIGSSYLPSDILAAALLAQLEQNEAVQAARRRVWEYYDRHLRNWAETGGVGLPTVPPHCEPAFHLYHLLLPSLDHRTKFIARLKSKGIQSVFHYLPLHSSPMGRNWGYRAGDCPVTEDISDRLVRLPFYNNLSPQAQARVCEAIFEVSRGW